jgi:hypothetical protein
VYGLAARRAWLVIQLAECRYRMSSTVSRGVTSTNRSDFSIAMPRIPPITSLALSRNPELSGRVLGDLVQALRCHREIGELSEVVRTVGLGHGALRVGGVPAEDLRPGDPNDKPDGHGQPHVVRRLTFARASLTLIPAVPVTGARGLQPLRAVRRGNAPTSTCDSARI